MLRRVRVDVAEKLDDDVAATRLSLRRDLHVLSPSTFTNTNDGRTVHYKVAAAGIPTRGLVVLVPLCSFSNQCRSQLDVDLPSMALHEDEIGLQLFDFPALVFQVHHFGVVRRIRLGHTLPVRRDLGLRALVDLLDLLVLPLCRLIDLIARVSLGLGDRIRKIAVAQFLRVLIVLIKQQPPVIGLLFLLSFTFGEVG